MDENTKKHIFEKFYQAEKSRSLQGNGLGLALVKRVVDIHGGKITVDSVTEREAAEMQHGSDRAHGTTFTVTLLKK